ncbi:MAG: hypothetical protein SNJ71_01855 [Bacteroidales bacterium]
MIDGALRLITYLQKAKIRPPDRIHIGVNSTLYFEWYKPSYTKIEIVLPIQAEYRSTDQLSSAKEAIYLYF